ncbi:tetratricopeptide repeat protein [Mucilaginibacter paludis]|uniref:Tetratricopeptide TPR_2 repeat-containing protein n=1 Tax=Mucilaginibacter paludis DSM 18603 TaxID=714943 RepID=H1YDQ7_9SPHI|nr:tetratricopeptide repeat protein [Mucilaginibacter paludis]EHQ30746.1 Tetratricopeptide TPR_2 repeat-containing protein [Mucilaginibacter paludis DSM 18603]
MKIRFLITGLSLVSVTAVFAQKGVLNDAQDAYNKYDALRGSQLKMALPSLTEAKTLIDKAAANEKTANLPLTYTVKGGVYSSLALLDTIPSTSTPLFITADEALKKAKELDTKGEYKKQIENGYRNLAQYKYNIGFKSYKAGNYNASYEAFNYYRTVLPEDTNAIYLTGLAAVNAKKYPEAIANYSNLVTTKYSNNANIYSDLVSIYLMNRDTTGALKAVTEAVAKYPANANLTNREIQLYLQTGRIKEVSDKLDKAIANDPKNKSLYYYSGYIYLQSKNYDKAAEQLNKALAIDPEYYEANLSMGYVYLNPGIDIFNKANNLPTTKVNQKKYDDMSASAVALFEKAKPYLVKASEINPKSMDALTSLRNVYLGKKDNVNANLIQKKIDALKN